jgi:homocysteine S-methyltransferase
MSRYRKALPQLGRQLFLTDGGLETVLAFHEGIDLPHFASFPLLKTAEGIELLRRYFDPFAELARNCGAGLILDSPTWRANRDWGAKLGYGSEALAKVNREAISLMETLRNEYERNGGPVVVSGCVGPRGDGYIPDSAMSPQEAESYHAEQIETLAGTTADMICAMTLNYVEEAIGVTRAACRAEMPVVISFTVETDGRLPTEQALADAIEQVDEETSGYPSYYMINCAHPSHFASKLGGDEAWLGRLRGLRANASRMSHAELDEAPELDIGDPAELGRDYAALKSRMEQLTVLGGCCGTDHRHIEQIATSCRPYFDARD